VGRDGGVLSQLEMVMHQSGKTAELELDVL
jgi:hypothetical protein